MHLTIISGATKQTVSIFFSSVTWLNFGIGIFGRWECKSVYNEFFLQEISNPIGFMAVRSKSDGFNKSHEPAGHKIKSTSENEMESSLIIRVCVSTTATHHDKHTNNETQNKSNQPHFEQCLNHKFLKTPGCVELWRMKWRLMLSFGVICMCRGWSRDGCEDKKRGEEGWGQSHGTRSHLRDGRGRMRNWALERGKKWEGAAPKKTRILQLHRERRLIVLKSGQNHRQEVWKHLGGCGYWRPSGHSYGDQWGWRKSGCQGLGE